MLTGNQRKALTYHGQIKGPHANRQNIMVLNALGKCPHPITIRTLHKIMNAQGFTIDLVSLRRAVTNLSKSSKNGVWLNMWGKAMIEVAEEKPCPITNRPVGWYRLIPTAFQYDMFNQNKTAA
jgi:hypothetical protein